MYKTNYVALENYSVLANFYKIYWTRSRIWCHLEDIVKQRFLFITSEKMSLAKCMVFQICKLYFILYRKRTNQWIFSLSRTSVLWSIIWKILKRKLEGWQKQNKYYNSDIQTLFISKFLITDSSFVLRDNQMHRSNFV